AHGCFFDFWSVGVLGGLRVFAFDRPFWHAAVTDMVPSRHLTSSGASPRWFLTTNWTLVLQASDTKSPEAAAALGHLCHVYWAPVNAFIRHFTHHPTNAEDLTQQFFAQFLEKQSYKLADRDRGRFRSFLITSVKHFLVNEWQRAKAQKRGGGQ